MIIYKDKLTDDEMISDVFDIKPGKAPGLWEVDGRTIVIGNESFQLEGANPSAEEEAEGDDTTSERKLDIAHQFRLNHMEAKPSKKAATAEMKSVLKQLYISDVTNYCKEYLKALSTHIKDTEGEDASKEFQKSALDCMKVILANWDNYDVYAGESMSEVGMWVLVDYREDGVTPYATFWSAGLKEMKV